MNESEKVKDNAQKPMTPEEHKAMEEGKRQQRVNECTLAVRQVLEEHNCELDVSVVLKAGQVIPRIAIMPIEVLQAQRMSQNQPE